MKRSRDDGARSAIGLAQGYGGAFPQFKQPKELACYSLSAPALPDALNATGAASAVAADFVGGYVEQCVRQHLQHIRDESELLAVARATLVRTDRRLAELAKAARTMCT